MTARGDRSALARYIDLLAGKNAAHSEIAATINAANPGARVAGPLVSRWRSQQVDVSPGNLAALARAYARSPLEAFVVVGLLTMEEARAGLDEKSVTALELVWSEDPIEIRIDDIPAGTTAGGKVTPLKSRSGSHDRRQRANLPVEEAARPRKPEGD